LSTAPQLVHRELDFAASSVSEAASFAIKIVLLIERSGDLVSA
jgi:hypothetical protein